MADEKKLEEAMEALIPILDEIKAFEEKYGDILNEFRRSGRALSEEERNKAAIDLLNKYSNL